MTKASIKKWSRAGAVAGAALVAGSASVVAGECSCSPQEGEITGLSSGCECESVVYPEFTPGSIVNQTVLMLQSTRLYFAMLSGRLSGIGPLARPGISSSVGPEGGTGLAAGELLGMPVGVWLNYTRSDSEDKFVGTAFDGSRDSVLGGVDVSPSANTLVGIALGWEDASSDTRYNQGNVDTDGITVAPYFAAAFGEIFSVDASFGYSSLSTDQFRTDPIFNNRVTSSLDSDRWFFGGNLNLGQQFGDLYVSGRTGIVYSREYQDAFTESDGTTLAERTVKLGQWRIGGDVSYLLGAFEPFAAATYEHDFSRTDVVLVGGPGAQPSNDNNGVVLGLGVRYFGPAGLSGVFEWTTVEGRDDYDENNFSLTLRVDF